MFAPTLSLEWQMAMANHGVKRVGIADLSRRLRPAPPPELLIHADSAPLRLTLFGHFRLTGPRGEIDLGSRKLCGLAAFLACTAPEPQMRDRLMTLFWGSHFDAQAKQNLRQALSRLRKALGPNALASDGKTVSLNMAAIQCDVGQFEALVRDGGRNALSAATDLYRGPLIDNVAVSEESWSEWLTAERSRLHELAIEAMVGLGRQELAAGRAELALKTAQRAIVLNNMREDAHRLVVQALAATGRKAEALKHYQDLVQLLKRELNTAPDVASEALVAELRTPQLPARWRAAPEHETNADAPGASHNGPPAAPPVRSGSAERRQLTVLVCTIVDSMPLAARLDPEEMRDLITGVHKRVSEAVAPFDGFVAQCSSEAVVVYFGYPVAREHDAERAVRAAFAVLDAVGGLKTRSDAALRARACVASGLVVVERSPAVGDIGRPLAIGEAPTIAAWLQAAASPGDVVIAASTRRLLGRAFDYRALPAIEVSGHPQPIEAWQVRGESADMSRFEARYRATLSPLVGRQEEILLLLRRWEDAKHGAGRVVLLSGEPGIGKSRILESLPTRLEEAPHARLRYFCSPHHTHSPLHPFITQIERAAGFEPGNSATKLDRLEALIKPGAKNLPRDLMLIADLVSVPSEGRYPALAIGPQQKREMTLSAILGLIEGIAAQGPVLIAFEDAHWSDPTSLDLLERIVARVANLPVLLVITIRSELQPSWVGQSHVTMLPLSRLGRQESAAMIGGLTGHKALPEAVIEQVLARADGVPLFIEELTSTLLESGLLRETGDRYVLDGSLPRLAIPTTLQDSLVARLDRLASKDVAQIGAAIGREFSHELLSAVAALPPADLDAALERLTASGLVSRRGMPPVATYAFRHALVQEAAYATLLKSQRRRLHASIANALVDCFPETVARLPEIAARHFTEAGLANEAIGYWRKAGQLATARSAGKEAVELFEEALHLLEAQPETPERLQQAIDLRFDLRTALVLLGEFERIFDCLNEAERIARSLGDHRRLGEMSVYMCQSLWTAGRHREALAFGQNAEALAASLGDIPLQVTANLHLGGACLGAGNYREAEGSLLKVVRLLDAGLSEERFGLPGFPAVLARSYLTWAFGDRGRFEEGIAIGQDGIRLAEALDHPYSLTHVCSYLAHLQITKGNLDDAVRLIERGRAVAREWNITVFAEGHGGSLGYAYALSGRPVDGIPLIEEAVNAFEAMGHRIAHAFMLVPLGEAYVLADRLEDALGMAEKALTFARDGAQRPYEARALRLLGEIAARRDSSDQADRHYRAALALAGELSMGPLLAHCHLGLGKLHRRRRERKQMQEHLTIAEAKYRELDMSFWLDQAEAETRG
jgi:DNA-binding SARP family transcriptional activator